MKSHFAMAPAAWLANIWWKPRTPYGLDSLNNTSFHPEEQGEFHFWGSPLAKWDLQLSILGGRTSCFRGGVQECRSAVAFIHQFTVLLSRVPWHYVWHLLVGRVAIFLLCISHHFPPSVFFPSVIPASPFLIFFFTNSIFSCFSADINCETVNTDI